MLKSSTFLSGNIKKDADLRKNKPKRPLSAYNIFYRLARESLDSSLSQHQDKGHVRSVFLDIFSMNNDELLKKSFDIQMNYRTDQCEKQTDTRKHKSRKLLGFQDLTRVIATQWAKVTPTKKAIFEKCSEYDKRMYYEMRECWMIQKDAKIKLRLEKQVLVDKNSNQNVGSKDIDVETVPNKEWGSHPISDTCFGFTQVKRQQKLMSKPSKTASFLLNNLNNDALHTETSCDLVPSSLISHHDQTAPRNDQTHIFDDKNSVGSTRICQLMNPYDTLSAMLRSLESQEEFVELIRETLINYALHGDQEIDLMLARNGYTSISRNTLLHFFQGYGSY